MPDKIRVLIVDDSALMRQILTAILSRDREIEVVGAAPDAYIANEKIKILKPDVLTLDIEMPGMDGLAFLGKLMVSNPMPVVMVSSLTETGCHKTLRALELGAVDFFTKPKLDLRAGIEEQAQDLNNKIKSAAKSRLIKRRSLGAIRSSAPSKGLPPLFPIVKRTDTVIAIGASTGGPRALQEILEVFPSNTPPILITQHMPEKFTKAFAKHLNSLCQISVKEAENGDSLLAGHALIAPGNYHMILGRNGGMYRVTINQAPPVNRHRPSVDVMFSSVAKSSGKTAIGIILTGMGNDGAEGMLEMKRAGSHNVCQDEESSVVFGMPKEAIAIGAVDVVCPLHDIPRRVFAYLTSSRQ